MVRRARDGRTWRIGTDAEVAWIANGTPIGLTITAAIPPVFDAYATVVLPDTGAGQHEHPADRSWLVSTSWDDDWTCIGGPVELFEPIAPGARLSPA